MGPISWVVVKGGRLRGERLHEASAERSSSWAIGEARGHCPLHNHASYNHTRRLSVPGALRSATVTIRAWQKMPGNADAYQNALQRIAEIAYSTGLEAPPSTRLTAPDFG